MCRLSTAASFLLATAFAASGCAAAKRSAKARDEAGPVVSGEAHPGFSPLTTAPRLASAVTLDDAVSGAGDDRVELELEALASCERCVRRRLTWLTRMHAAR